LASNRYECQDYFLGGKGGWCIGLTSLPPSCAVISWSLSLLEPSGPIQACTWIVFHAVAIFTVECRGRKSLHNVASRHVTSMKTMILKSVFFICKVLLKSGACKCSKHLGATTKFKVSDKCSIVSSVNISQFHFYIYILVYDLYRSINLLTPNDDYSGRTAPTSKCCILYIYSTNIGTEYFKHGIYTLFFPLQNAVCFINVTYLVPVLFTFYIQSVLKLKK